MQPPPSEPPEPPVPMIVEDDVSIQSNYDGLNEKDVHLDSLMDTDDETDPSQMDIEGGGNRNATNKNGGGGGGSDGDGGNGDGGNGDDDGGYGYVVQQSTRGSNGGSAIMHRYCRRRHRHPRHASHI